MIALAHSILQEPLMTKFRFLVTEARCGAPALGSWRASAMSPRQIIRAEPRRILRCSRSITPAFAPRLKHQDRPERVLPVAAAEQVLAPCVAYGLRTQEAIGGEFRLR